MPKGFIVITGTGIKDPREWGAVCGRRASPYP